MCLMEVCHTHAILALRGRRKRIFYFFLTAMTSLMLMRWSIASTTWHLTTPHAVIFGFNHQVDGKKTKSRSTLEGIYRGKDIVNEILPRIIGVSFEEINQWIRCNKAFKTEKESPALWHIMCDAEVIRKNDLRFDENLSVGEDLSFFCTYLLYEQSVGYLDEYLYTYILRDGGANLQNQSNARKRIENKTKLISARLKLDELALQLYGADIHKYWEGTLVLSCIQAGLCMAKDKNGNMRNNYLLYKKIVNIDVVKDACMDFKPLKA